jgi:hypothetical protein
MMIKEWFSGIGGACGSIAAGAFWANSMQEFRVTLGADQAKRILASERLDKTYSAKIPA